MNFQNILNNSLGLTHHANLSNKVLSMFSYPLLFGRDNLYAILKVAPEALADEIREAKSEAIIALDEVRAALDTELKAIEVMVPELAEARQQVKIAQAKAEKEPQAFERAREELAEADARAMGVNPRYREMLREIEEIERRKIRINQITIDNPEARQQYDREHPPLALLKISDANRDGFVENRTTITLLRRELSQFILAKGEEIFHPSDLYREDFSADFAHSHILDQE